MRSNKIKAYNQLVYAKSCGINIDSEKAIVENPVKKNPVLKEKYLNDSKMK